jgi:hypothetical protein
VKNTRGCVRPVTRTQAIAQHLAAWVVVLGLVALLGLVGGAQ